MMESLSPTTKDNIEEVKEKEEENKEVLAEEEEDEISIDDEILFITQSNDGVDGLLVSSSVTTNDGDSNDDAVSIGSSSITSTTTKLWNWMTGGAGDNTTRSSSNSFSTLRSSGRPGDEKEDREIFPSNATTTTTNSKDDSSLWLSTSTASMPYMPLPAPKMIHPDDTFTDGLQDDHPTSTHIATLPFSNQPIDPTDDYDDDDSYHALLNNNNRTDNSGDVNDVNNHEKRENKNNSIKEDWGEEGSFVSYDSQNQSEDQSSFVSWNPDDEVSIMNSNSDVMNRHGVRKDELLLQMKQQHYLLNQNHTHHRGDPSHNHHDYDTFSQNNSLISRQYWKQKIESSSTQPLASLWNKNRNNNNDENEEWDPNMFPPSYKNKKTRFNTLGLGMTAHGLGLNNDAIVQSILQSNDNVSNSDTPSSTSENDYDNCWWIQDLKERDCLGHDTNTIPEISPKQSPKKTASTKVFYNPVIDALMRNVNSNTTKTRPSQQDDTFGNENENDDASSVDSDTNTNDTMERPQEEQDTKFWNDLDQRFWTTARTYHFEAYPNYPDYDNHLVPLSSYNIKYHHHLFYDDSKSAEEIKEFQFILKLCLKLYIYLIHNNDTAPLTQQDNSTSSEKKDEEEKEEGKNENQQKEESSSFVLEKVSPYVPLSVTLALFETIIQYYYDNYKKHDDNDDNDQDSPNDEIENDATTNKSDDDDSQESSSTNNDENTFTTNDDYDDDEDDDSSYDDTDSENDSRAGYSTSSETIFLKQVTSSLPPTNDASDSKDLDALKVSDRKIIEEDKRRRALFAKVVLKAILSSEMDIFRHYEVNHMDDNDKTKEDDEFNPHRLFLRKELFRNYKSNNENPNNSNSKTTMSRKELDEFLYGDDSDDDSDDENDDTINKDALTSNNEVSKHSSKGKRKKKHVQIVDDRKEIRLRKNVVQYFTKNNHTHINLLSPPQILDDSSDNNNNNNNNTYHQEWNFLFSQNVLLNSILCQTIISTNDSSGQTQLSMQLSSTMSDKQYPKRGVPAILQDGIHRDPLLSELYALKYIPLFLLRSMMMMTSMIQENLPKEDHRFIMTTAATGMEKIEYHPHEKPDLYFEFLLLNEKFLEANHFAFGPYLTTVSTLQNWKFFQFYTTQCEYIGLHNALSSTLAHIRDIVSKDDESNDIILSETKKNQATSSSLPHSLPSSTNNNSIVSLLEDSNQEKKVYRPRVMSCCVEIGRSFYHLGISLGRRNHQQQQQVSSNLFTGTQSNSNSLNSEDEHLEVDQKVEKSDDERNKAHRHNDKIVVDKSSNVTSVELSAYDDSIRSYRQSLTFLSTSESSLNSSLESIIDYPLEVDPDRKVGKDRKEQLELQLNEIRNAKISTELYLADVMSAAGYCYDAKLSQYEKALSFYIDAKNYYTTHIGVSHFTVANTLQNIGTIYFELKKWDEAIDSFTSRASTLEKLMNNSNSSTEEDKSNHMSSSVPSSNPAKELDRSSFVNEEIAFTLHSLAASYAGKEDYESAIKSNTDAIEKMREVMSSKTNSIIGKKRHYFISVVLSEIGCLQTLMSSKIQSNWYSRCFQMLYSSNVTDWRRDRKDESFITRVAHLEWSAINSFDESIELRIQQKNNICLNYDCQQTPFSISSFGLLRSEESKFKHPKSSDDNEHEHIDSINTDNVVKEVLEIGALTDDYLTVKENTVSDILQLTKDLYCVGKLRFHQKDYRLASYDLTDALILLLNIASYTRDNQYAPEEALNNNGNSLSLETILLCNFSFLSIKLLSLLSSALTRLEHFDKAIQCLSLAISIYQKEEKEEMKQHDESKTNTASNDTIDNMIDCAKLHHKIAHLHFLKKNNEESIHHFRSALRIYDNAADTLEATENDVKIDKHVEIREIAKKGEETEAKIIKINEDMMRKTTDFVEDSDIEKIQIDSADVKQKRIRQHFREVNVKNNLALLLYSLGKSYYNLYKLNKARRCFEDAIEILDSEDQNILVGLSPDDFCLEDIRTLSFSSIQNLQIERIHFSPSVLMSCLGDTYRRIGKSFLKQDLRQDALLCFERSIEILERLAESIVSQVTRDDDAIDIIDDIKLDSSLLECYEYVLDLLGNRRLDRKIIKHHSALIGLGMKNKRKRDKLIEFRSTKEDILFRMGNIYARRRRFNKAITCYTAAEDLTVKRLGTRDHFIIANLLHNMGNVFKDMCMLVYEGSDKAGGKSIKLFEESIKISTSIHGPDHPFVAESKNNMAHVFLHLSSLAKEEEKKNSQQKASLNFFVQSIEIMTSFLGESHIVVVDALQSMGILYLQSDDIDKASLILGKVFEDQQLLFGPSHLKVGETSYFMGKIHIQKAKKFFEKNASEKHIKELNLALKFLFQSFEILRREVTNNAICDEESKGDKGLDAEKKLKQRKIHVDISNTMLTIVLVQQALGRTEDAKFFLSVAMRFLQSHVLKSQAQGEKSKIYRQLSANAWGINAELNNLQDNLSGSIESYMESLNFIGKTLDSSLANSEYTNKLLLLGSVYSRTNQSDKALRCYAVCLSSLISEFGNDSIEVASIFQMIGREHIINVDKINSLKCYRAAFHVYSRIESTQTSKFEKGMKGILHQHYGEIVFDHGVGAKEEAYKHFNLAVTLIEDVRSRELSSETAILFQENSARDKIYRIALSFDSWDHRLMKCYSSLLKLTKFVLKKDNEVEEAADVLHRIGNIYTVFENYDKAMLCFFEVINFQRSTHGDNHLSVADLLFNIGNIYFQKGDSKRALECHEECYRISYTVLGGNCWEMLEHLQYLQTISYQLCRYRDSIFWCKKKLDIIRQHTSDKELLLLTLQQLGNAHEKCGEYQLALKYLNESLKIGRKIWNEDDIRLANILNSLGNVHSLLRENKKSLEFYNDCLTINLQTNKIIAVAKVKDDIASLLAVEGNFTSSEHFFAEALHTKTKNLGCDNIEVARTLCNLAHLYADLFLHDRALSYLQEGMRILRLNLTEYHDEIAAGLNTFGIIYYHQGQQRKALKYYSDSLSIFRDEISSDNILVATMLKSIGSIYRTLQDFETSAKYFHDATNAFSLHFGHVHELTAEAQCCLGYVLYEMKQYDESLKNITDVVKARILCFGRDSLQVSETILMLGRIYAKLDNYKEAMFCLKEGLQFTSFGGTFDSKAIADNELLLANTYVAMNENEKSIFHFEKALRIKQTSNITNSLDLADVHLQLGSCLLEIGSFTSSMVHLQKSLELKTSGIGVEAKEISFIVKKIGQLQRKQGNIEVAINQFQKALTTTLSIGDETHYDVAEIYFELGQCYFSDGNFAEALSMFMGSSKILRALNGTDNLPLFKDVMVYQANAFFLTRQYTRASKLYAEILTKMENSENCSSLEIAEVYRCLGKSYQKEKQYEQAFNAFSESSRIFTSHYPKINCSMRTFNLMTNDAYIEMLEELIDLAQNEVSVNQDILGNLFTNLGDAFARSSNNAKAIYLYEQALEIQKKSPQSEILLSALFHNIGNCLYNQGMVVKSISYHEKALALTKQFFDENHHDLANSFFSLAMANQLNSNYDVAISMYENALMIRANIFGVESIEVGFTLQGLALAFESKGDYNQALKTCEEAIRIQKLNYIEENSNIAVLYRCLGRIHRSNGDIEMSLHCLNSALSIIQGVVTNNHLEVGKNLFELGISHEKRNEESECNDLFRQALDIFFQKIFPDESDEEIIYQIDTNADENSEFFRKKLESYITNNENVIANADTILLFGKLLERNNRLPFARLCYESSKNLYKDRLSATSLRLGESLHCEGRISFLLKHFNHAEKLLRDALFIRKEVLPDIHEHVEESSNILGLVLAELKKNDESLRLLEDAVIARMTRANKVHPFGKNESETLLRIGKIHHERKEHSQAMSCYEQSLHEAKKKHIGENEEIGDILFHIGDLSVDIREDDKAMYNLENALEIFTEYNFKSSKIGQILLRLGDLHLQCNCPDKAITCYDKCLDHRKCFGESENNSLSVAEVLKCLGHAYLESKNFSLATKYCSEALQIMKRNLDKDHTEISLCWFSLAQIYLEEKRTRESLSCFQYALRLMRLSLPKNHINIGNVLDGIGLCLFNLNEYDKAVSSFKEALKIKIELLGMNDIGVAETTQNMGRAQLMLGQYENAFIQFETSIQAKLSFIGYNKSNNHKHILECKNCIDAVLMIVKRISGSDCETYATYLQKRGICLGLMQKFGPAIKSYRKAITILTKIYGVDHIIVANLFFNLGLCMNEYNNPDEGLEHLLEALKISIRKIGDEHQDLIDILYQIGIAYEMKRMFTEATKYFEDALLVLKNNSQYDTLKCALIINHIGNIAKRENSLEKSETSFKECLKIRILCLGPNAIEVSDTYANLGATHLSKRAYQKAIRCNEECLRIRKNKLGKKNQSAMDIYMILGYIHDSIGNYSKAIKCYDFALSSYKLIYGESHEFISRVYANKGGILYKMYKLHDALTCFKDALRIKSKFTINSNKILDDEESADIMCSLGEIYVQLGEFNQALSSYKAALSIYEKTVGKEHISVAKALHGLAVLLIKQEEMDEALSHTTEALRLRQKNLGNENELTGDSLFCMGTIYFISKRYKESLSVLQLAYYIHTTKRGRQHLSSANDEFFIACIYEKWNDQDRAMEIFQNCLVGRKLNLGLNHPDVGEVFSHLASIHMFKNEKKNALSCLQECFRIRMSHFGRNHIYTADILVRLGDAFKASEKTDEAIHSYSEAIETYKLCLGDKHLKIANCCNKKAYVYSILNEFQNVIVHTKMALQIYSKLLVKMPSRKDLFHRDLKDDYLEYASCLVLLATTSDYLGNDDTAAKTYNKALRLYKHLFGRDSTQVSNILLNLAIMRGKQQKYDKAIVLLEETLRITISNYGAENENVAKVLFSMGIMFDKRNEYDAAIRAYMDCLDIQRTVYGDESDVIAQTLINIGIVQANEGHFRSAIECWEECIHIYQNGGMDSENDVILGLSERIKMANSMYNEGRGKNERGLFR